MDEKVRVNKKFILLYFPICQFHYALLHMCTSAFNSNAIKSSLVNYCGPWGAKEYFLWFIDLPGKLILWLLTRETLRLNTCTHYAAPYCLGVLVLVSMGIAGISFISFMHFEHSINVASTVPWCCFNSRFQYLSTGSLGLMEFWCLSPKIDQMMLWYHKALILLIV